MPLIPTGFMAKAIPAYPVRLAVGFTASAVVLGFVGFVLVNTGSVAALDEATRTAAQRISNDPFTAFFRTVTRFGSTLYLTAIGSAAVIAFLGLKWFRAAWLFLVATAGQIVLHHGFKYLIGRDRPEPIVAYMVDESYSFPSGHAIAGLVVYLSLAWLCANRLQKRSSRVLIVTAAILVAAAIGISRTYFGVHYATDVLAGWASGLIWTTAVMSGDRPEVLRSGKTA